MASIPQNGATSPKGTPHPGTIVTEDRIRDSMKEQSAADVPVTIAWVQQPDGGYAAVTRIEITGTEDQMRITKFGDDGTMLESTTMMAPPPMP